MTIEEFYDSIGIPLEQCGTRWKAVCPFHADTSPSFVVYPSGDYHCFGCGAHGGLSTLKEQYNVDMMVVPSVDYTADPIKEKLNELRDRYENDLILHTSEASTDKRINAYDLFDRMFIDSYALIDDPDVSLVDLIVFLRTEFSKIINLLKI